VLSFFRSRMASFGYAFEGWWYVLRTQKNAWIHAFFSLAVFFVSFWLGLSRQEWAIILLTITLVWVGEFINTALEAVVDLVSPEHHQLAKVCKDVGAAAVLIAAGTSVMIGVLILGPPLWARVSPFFGL